MRTVVDSIMDHHRAAGTLTVLGASRPVSVALTWAEVHMRARRMSTVLAGRGLGPGCRVGLLGDTSMDLVVALQAIWLTGAAVTVLPPPVRGGRREYAGQLAAIVGSAGLAAVIADVTGGSSGTNPAVAAELTGLTRLIPLAELSGSADAVAPATPFRPHPENLAVLQYTSGSTRNPRGVPVTHAHLAANIAAIRAATRHDDLHPAPTMSWLPLYHDMGLVGFLTLPMACGCPLVLQSPATFASRPGSWLEAMSRYRITTSGAPNFAYRLVTRLLAAGIDVDLSMLRLLLSGGEPVDAATMAQFVAAARPYGLDPLAVVPAYGLAESTLAVTFSPPGTGVRLDRVDPRALESAGRVVPAAPGAPARELVKLGRPVPGTSLRIVDRHTGDPVGPRVVGHLEIRGPSVVGHYWGDPAPPAGRWLRTGDIGYLTAEDPDDGSGPELVVCGREKDVLFAAGRNVFPQDIEAAVAAVPGVRPGGVVAFGVAGEQGDRLVVAVEARGVDPQTLRHGVAAAVLGEVGLAPNTVVTLPFGRIPKTSSGKLRRAEARRQYLSGRLCPAGERTIR